MSLVQAIRNAVCDLRGHRFTAWTYVLNATLLSERMTDSDEEDWWYVETVRKSRHRTCLRCHGSFSESGQIAFPTGEPYELRGTVRPREAVWETSPPPNP